MPTIIVSEKDPASVGIGEYLVENYFERTERTFEGRAVFEYCGVDLITIKSEHIYADWIEKKYPSDIYIVASRHSAESGMPSLTVHPTGNWGKAIYGGENKKLSFAPAQNMLSALKYLKARKVDGFSVSYEVTHHGPTLDTPIMFVEVGSSPKEWRDGEAVAVVAEAIIRALRVEDVETAVGVGGGHYAPRFTEIALKRGVAFGHILPKYAIKYADRGMLKQAVEKTIPRPKYFAVQGAGEEIQEILKELGLKRIK